MKVVTWNINGIRTFKNGIKKALDSLDADIICVQETKVTRDLLDERTAIVDGYSSYFSFCRGRSGYSGVATFCKENVTPIAAEEGLTGLLTNHDGAVGCYGDQNKFSAEELQLLDSEGRAVITQHKVMCGNDVKTVTLLNVYCPRADPDKPERKLFKLQFYKLLQDRAEAILRTGSHVIVLGDVNTSHEPIDHCDPGEIENFEENPGRKWLNSFLSGRCKEPERDDVEEATLASRTPGDGGKFVDMFRSFHPTRTNAFTCWSTRTGARQTNYGTRIDYIFADCKLAETHFLEANIMPEVEGSDHCPVRGRLCCAVLPSPRCPPLCTRHMPEFAGRQQKLSQFLVKVNQPTLIGSADALPGSQESGEVRENLIPFESENRSTKRKGSVPESSASKGKRSKVTKAKTTPQGSLLAFFKAKSVQVIQPSSNHYGIGEESREQIPSQSLIATPDRLSPCAVEPVDVKGGKEPEGEEGEGEVSCCSDAVGDAKEGSSANGQLSLLEQDEDSRCPRSGGSQNFWRAVLRGPPQPPKCKVHEEPCVLRTVKKAGPNMGRQFFVCARPQGHTSNPQARCNFFAWVDKGK